MKLIDKLIIYTYNKMNELENEKEELRRQIRRQPVDSLDLYEIMRTDIRLECWNEFITDLYRIIINSQKGKGKGG